MKKDIQHGRKTRSNEGDTLQYFCQGGTLMLWVLPIFAWYKVNLLLSISVLLFFYHLKSAITNLGWTGEASPQYFHQGGTNAFVLPTFAWHKVNLLSSSLVTFIYFYRLKSVITNMGGTSPQHFHQGEGALILLSLPTFAWHKVNVLSSSSVLLRFPPAKVSNNKPGMDGENKPPNNLVACIPTIIWRLCWLMLLSPSNFHDTKLIIKFSSFIFLPPDVSDGKTREGRVPPQHFHRVGALNALAPQLFHDTKSVFCHQVQFFYFFYHLKSVI